MAGQMAGPAVAPAADGRPWDGGPGHEAAYWPDVDADARNAVLQLPLQLGDAGRDAHEALSPWAGLEGPGGWGLAGGGGLDDFGRDGLNPWDA